MGAGSGRAYESGGGASRAQGGPTTMKAEGRARAERTPNMFCMSVTLDVSKLSGWLNAVTLCRVQREGIDEGAAGGPGDGRALGAVA